MWTACHEECPMCGGAGELVNLAGSDIFYARCVECGAHTYAVHKPQNAVYEWDMRRIVAVRTVKKC